MSDRIQIKGIGELIAAVPNVLGFVPELSTLLLLFRGDRLVWTARRDFGARQLAVAAEALAKTGEADRVTVVIVADSTPFAEVVAEAAKTKAALLDLGMDVTGMYYTPRIDGGQQWTEVETLQCGTIPAPETTEVAVTYAAAGKIVAAGRDEIAARYRRGDLIPSEVLAAALDFRHANRETFAGIVLADLAHVVRSRTEPDVDLIARTSVLLLTDITARDAMLGLVRVDSRVATETTAAIARRLDGHGRVAALTVAGFTAYAHGDGVAAGYALAEARAGSQALLMCDTKLLGLLEQALRAGLEPARIAQLAETGVRIARESYRVNLGEPESGHWH
ncbi:DUF4192 domain-containing protein [Rhodococcus ruber]|uniref:DUF4192 domain-containing protein n=1 Tax=Rhodococcus ruber TaxID=1830 RepID=UPI00177B140D|nr:DUF4192 domain-containing protein [Rhodococcus ruber]MBD8056432.1 DUF4192 domain-containing protein [Rhodococcus ruber]